MILNGCLGDGAFGVIAVLPKDDLRILKRNLAGGDQRPAEVVLSIGWKEPLLVHILPQVIQEL